MKQFQERFSEHFFATTIAMIMKFSSPLFKSYFRLFEKINLINLMTQQTTDVLGIERIYAFILLGNLEVIAKYFSKNIQVQCFNVCCEKNLQLNLNKTSHQVFERKVIDMSIT
ncbi:CLUMA_CG002716, isoform A [Clunio marinus]|uniref:CLUMA_CG002716, isoform A n=1 Tax=Clunio marinus TaxID=568069 RepID=A0A1J1HLA0_9DIPT|nr:CLUMA_CG002716, isoform A [Clunio marinus]